MRKILITVLAMLLCASMLASCGGLAGIGGNSAFGSGDNGTGGDLPEGTTPGGPGNNDPVPPKDQTENLDIIVLNEDGTHSSDYRIIYNPAGKEWEKTAAFELQKGLEILTGVQLPVLEDSEFDDEPETLRQPKEILIGETNRTNEYDDPDDLSAYNKGYAAFVAYDRLVIKAGSKTGMYLAIRNFFYDNYGQDMETMNKSVDGFTPFEIGFDASLSLNFTYRLEFAYNSELFPYIGDPLKSYKIWHDGSYMQKRMANLLRDQINTLLGVKLDVVETELSDTAPAFVLTQDDTMDAGTWTVEVKGNRFNIKGNGYYAFSDVINFFKSNRNNRGYYEFKGTESGNGDYVTNAKGSLESTKFAYNKAGTTRVMFYNVLFNNSASSGSGENKVSYNVPTAERNYLQSLMIAEYMPDVLGCQEFNKTKREGQNAQTLNGDRNLVTLLEGLGYAEAVDPRVKNAYPSTEEIPGTDASLTQDNVAPGTPLKGYGTSGAVQVTVGGETYYTYYNNTPIFYNTVTTKILQDKDGNELAGYYWYKNQWNKKEGVNHENGASDCGSKAATWAIFESKVDGSRYIVISTHMCTRNDYVRSLQAQEVIDLINELTSMYNYPVFFGGDMNGNNDDSNYNLFIKDEAEGGAGYKSLQDHDVATEYTSKVFTHHGYPNFDGLLGYMTPGTNNTVHDITDETGKNSIDQIFVTNNGEDVKINVFGVIVDECSMSSSDHLPIFVDFTIEGESVEDAIWGPTVTV